MKNPIAVAVALVLALASAVQAADEADSFPGVKKLMSSEQFTKAGLDRLSAEELTALDAWLLSYTAGEAPIMLQTNEEVREAIKDVDIRSRIVGEFKGWSGETLFRLENGQIWRQRLSGRYFYSGPPSPEVSIGRNFMGFYVLRLVETGKSVGVKLVN